jgi:hypothetical protein
MTRYIDLGRVDTTHAVFRGDLDIILRSNVLVQANSGGGKSYLLRRMIEQSFGLVPQIVIDPEGEFSTLRQKFDLVLVGKGGDTPADLRSAQLLAHRLLELGASAVIDLFEMSKQLRPVWVAAFVQALVDAPKKLWRDLLLYVDEAHELAPEAGHGAHESSAEKQCRHALIDMAAKGRKRGYGVVAATQRLGKLSKDFAAELKNVLIGQTFIDIDRERAAGSLGIAKADRAKFFVDVKTLHPGTFYSLGRAFTLEPTLVKIGGVQTEHPEAGRRQSAPPPPTEKIRHLLPQLADLPKEAETKLQTEKELRAKIVELERTVKSAASAEATRLPPPAQIVEKSVLKPADLARIEKTVETLQRGEAAFFAKVAQVSETLANTRMGVEKELARMRGVLQASSEHRGTVTTVTTPTMTVKRMPDMYRVVDSPIAANDGPPLSKCARALLNVLAQRSTATDSQISMISGYRITSSSFANGLSELRTKGLIVGTPERREVTESGRTAAGDVEPLPRGPELLGYWARRLSKAEATMLKVIYKHQTISRGALSTESGYSITSSSFANALSGLRTLELIHGPSGGDLTIADIFNE